MPEPTKIPRPFADSGDKNAIPDSSGSIGFASWQEGFPAITSEPFSQGGVAPKRADFNGVFNALSAATVWNQQGGVYAYDNTTDYEVGNVVLYSGDLYKCITANGPSSAVKDPTDTTVWDAIATASGYLPLSGGTMTGNLALSTNPSTISHTLSNSYLRILSSPDYDSGSSLYLSGKDRSTYAGCFTLYAFDGVNRSTLLGYPDGTLEWNGDKIPTYETGTWTPVLMGSTIAGAFTYDANTSGYYVKIGTFVFFYCRIGTTDYNTHPTGRVRLSGLPYLSYNHNPSFTMINALGYAGGVNSSVLKICGGSLQNNTSYIDLIAQSSDTPWQKGVALFSSTSATGYNVQFNASNKTATLYVSGCYEAGN